MGLGFIKWMEESKKIDHIGKVAVFYIPSNKLTDEIKKEMHHFFVSRHKAYTHESGDIKGYWHDGERLTSDSHERYEISFKGREKFREFVDFLSEICKKIGEKSIYLTIADDSYLVRPD